MVCRPPPEDVMATDDWELAADVGGVLWDMPCRGRTYTVHATEQRYGAEVAGRGYRIH